MEDVKRKLNFETSSEASTAASSGQKGQVCGSIHQGLAKDCAIDGSKFPAWLNLRLCDASQVRDYLLITWTPKSGNLRRVTM